LSATMSEGRLTLPREFGYVVLSLSGTWIANYFLQIRVMRARKRYDVQYPLLYADESHANRDE